MSWIGLSDLNVSAFDPEGVRPDSNRFCSVDEDALLPTGTILVEAAFTARPRMPQRLIRLERRTGWLRSLSMQLSADGVLGVELRQGDAASRIQLTITPPPSGTCLRITYAWDAPGRRALLTVENLDQELVYQTEATAPLPLPLADLREIALNRPSVRFCRELRYVAISDRVEPVGLPAGVAAGTPVETPSGPQFVDRLRLGDMVLTWSGEARPVRWIARREVPALGRFRPVRLRAPYFGLTRDILCAPDHRIMIGGVEAEYLLGESAVLVDAAHLVDGSAVLREKPRAPTLCYYHLLLDSHECLHYAGLWGESLFVGAIGRSPELMATTALADLPVGAIPRHTRFALPILSGAEARSLTHSMSA